ncbi:unnamed protein product [Ascophyllum nodosum]
MTNIFVARFVYLMALWAFAVEAFVVTPRSSPLSLTRLTRDLTSSYTDRTVVGVSGTRIPFVQAPRMSSYEEGPTETGEEKQYEMQELIVDFTDDGRILLEVKGVKGPECRQITEELIKSLGDVIHTENTSEYFQEKVVNTNVLKESVQQGWSYDAKKPEW